MQTSALVSFAEYFEILKGVVKYDKLILALLFKREKKARFVPYSHDLWTFSLRVEALNLSLRSLLNLKPEKGVSILML